jgi:hypothetical protein
MVNFVQVSSDQPSVVWVPKDESAPDSLSHGAHSVEHPSPEVCSRPTLRSDVQFGNGSNVLLSKIETITDIRDKWTTNLGRPVAPSAPDELLLPTEKVGLSWVHFWMYSYIQTHALP